MKIKILIITLLICIISIAIFIACESKPTKPEYNNVFDPGNPTTSGDPFELQVTIGNGGVTLTWTKPDIQNLTNFKIYRSEQETSGYNAINTITATNTQYVDQTVENGFSYWYRVAALDGSGNETGTTNISAINIKTDPVLVINGGDEYTPNKEVNLTILANTAQQMMLSNASDFSGANWETYTNSKNWTLLTGDGEKLVYMKVQYADGTESPVVIDTITPQSINPTIEIEFGVQYTPTRDIQLTILADGINLQMKLSEDSTFTGLNWETYSITPIFQLSIGEGIKKVFTIIKNDLEIESPTINDVIILDTTPPISILLVSPDSGITNETLFQFDPTSSSDNLAPLADMQIRFDWENDGNWDTGWQQLAIINNLYSQGGGDKTIRMQIQDGADWTADTTKQIFVNTRPVASFTATQDTANLVLYHFDASTCSDYEDGENIQYRWDFDGDGSWETGWLAQDTISHLYSNTGDYWPKLSVIDLNNLTAEITVSINVFDGTVTDIDGNVYQTVKIGNQWWMAENLKVTRYNNGDAIPNVTDNTQWSNLTTGAYCNYDNDINNVAVYGRLYNWYAAEDSRNIAPVGWHVPSDTEWQTLVDYLGGSSVAGGKMKEAGTAHWLSPNTGATNTSGFTALPAGYRSNNGSFSNMSNYGYWWSATEYSTAYAWYRLLSYLYSQVDRYYGNKRYGFSIRCIRD